MTYQLLDGFNEIRVRITLNPSSIIHSTVHSALAIMEAQKLANLVRYGEGPL